MKPQRFGRYELLEQLGHGGMATILLARLVGPSDFQKHLVIKRIHDHLTTDDETIHRFLDEARLAARIHHPNVVQLFEFDQFNGTYYIAMEYVHGETLADLYNQVRKDSSGGYHWGHAARVIAEAAAGLHAAHELVGGDGESLRIVHRDVSPQNIMVTYDGHVKVADFGIAHAVGRHHNTVDGTVMGKVAYMSPEQCRGEALDRRTDVFALGIVLYEMVCLRRLFRVRSDQETMRRVLQCDFTPPRQVRPELPVGLEKILLKALAAQPEDRYQTAAELQYAIDGLLASERAMITASSLAALMTVVFQQEKLLKDRRIQKIYSQTFMEPSRPISAKAVADHVAAGAATATAWDESNRVTDRDLAPPAAAPHERRESTMRGFGTPQSKPIETLDQWADEGPTVVDHDLATVAGKDPSVADATNLAEPVVWPPGDPAHSGITQPVGPGPARRVQNLGPTVELSPSGGGVRSEPRGAVQTLNPEVAGGGGASPSLSNQAPANRLSGEISVVSENAPTTVRHSKPTGQSTDSIMVQITKKSVSRILVIGIGAAVALGVLMGVALTYLGNRGRSEARKRSKPSSAVKQEMVTLRFKVSPPGATLLLDGRELPAPADGGERVVQVPWQETPLLVKVQAEGYRTEERSVMPEKSQSLEFQLKRSTVSTQPLAPMSDAMEVGMRPPPPRRRTRRRRRHRTRSLSDPAMGWSGDLPMNPADDPPPGRRPRARDLKDPFGTRRRRRGRFGEGTLRPSF